MVQRKDGKIKHIVLERQSDFDLIKEINSTVKGVDAKVDAVCTGLAVIGERVGTLNNTAQSNIKRISILEKVVWTAIGGASVVVFVLKVMVK